MIEFRSVMKGLLALVLVVDVVGGETKRLSPEVIKNAREIHKGFKGESGRVAQFGDSITYSMAFWSAMSWSDPGKFLPADDGLPKLPAGKQWKNVIKGARNKGTKFSNYSGWKVGNLLKSVDAVIARDKPEAALIMIGTNDINGKKVPDGYRAGLEKVVSKCLVAHCVPILNTIPPRRDRDEAVTAVNVIVREIAAEQKLPLVDFHASCLQVRPGKTWDGTIISKDGVHPSGGMTNLYNQKNLKDCGYALRNWVNFLAYRQLYFEVFAAK
jgi:lysophospholipase L1-like esterase